MDIQGLAVVPLEKGEIGNAKKYWENLKGADLGFYDSPQPWSKGLGDLAKELKAKTVFEYGCHVGRNLRIIRDISECEVSGIDVNSFAVKHGKEKHGLDLKVGDHNSLKKIKENSFDMVITVSALDHTPAIDVAIKNIVRISKSWIVCIEPFEYGSEGRLEEYFDHNERKMKKATPYTYIWNYENLFASRKKVKEISIDQMSLPGVNLGPYYKLIIVKV